MKVKFYNSIEEIKEAKEIVPNSIIHADCLEAMQYIQDKSIDAIITDPPYGTTACNWDSIIPFESMWKQLNRIIKDNGAICLFGSEPFSSYLRISNIKNYKYDWVWNKKFAGSFGIAKFQPMRINECISVFNVIGFYYPIMIKREIPIKSGGNKVKSESGQLNKRSKYFKKTYNEKYPISVLEYSVRSERGLHPTQKPVSLIEYLVRTYTNENEIVLDFTIGSGTTAIACMNTNRKFIGIEKEKEYIDVIRKRIETTVIPKKWFFR